jgi:hypothetical protein
MRRLALAICLVAAVRLSADDGEQAALLATVLQKAGERVQHFFTRAQSIVCLEVVTLQPLNAGMTNQGFGRIVESELRLSWQPGTDGRPATEAQTLRQLLRVNGQKPRQNDWKNCTTPEQTTQETQDLSLLLPSQREEYRFELRGETKIDGRAAIMIDYRLLKEPKVESHLLEGRDDCISFDIDGGMRGRIWIDAATHDVLRLDQRLHGLVEIPLPRKTRLLPNDQSYWTMERWDTTIRFRPMTFANPDETLVLPESRSSLQVTRGAGTPRLRTTTSYKNYQRFVTGGRVVGN